MEKIKGYAMMRDGKIVCHRGVLQISENADVLPFVDEKIVEVEITVPSDK